LKIGLVDKKATLFPARFAFAPIIFVSFLNLCAALFPAVL